MQREVNGTPPTGTSIHEVIRDATAATSEMLKTFVNTAQLSGFPANLINPSGFQLTMQTVMLNNQSSFYNSVTQILLEILARTEGSEGGLDPKAIQREMARRNVAVAMGPDPEILQQLVQGSNHATVRQEQEMEDMRQQIFALRGLLGELADRELDENLKTRAKTLLAITRNIGVDPGSIPQNIPIDGTLTTPQEPQP